jgi:membrane-bound lytic murein transglycosylase D
MNNDFSFSHLAEIIEVSVDDLKWLNPVYKNDQIMVKAEPHTIYLPKEKIADFSYCEQDVYNMYLCSVEPADGVESTGIADAALQKTHVRTHVVKSGESLGLIANKYRCSVTELMTWNDLHKGIIHPGQKLSVHTVDVAQLMAKSAETISKDQVKSKSSTKTEFVYYTVQKGDTLWDIANLRGVSVQQLKNLNNINNEKSLQPGMRIKVSQVG